MTHTYLIALGSNRRHQHLGSPHEVVSAAMDVLGSKVGDVLACSPIIASEPIGPSIRRYANAALLLESQCEPQDLLCALKLVEHEFGRRRGGQRWSARVLDLDIVLWSGGIFASGALCVPHQLFRIRDFVLGPAATTAPNWRDPITGLSLRQLHSRLTRPRTLPR